MTNSDHVFDHIAMGPDDVMLLRPRDVLSEDELNDIISRIPESLKDRVLVIHRDIDVIVGSREKADKPIPTVEVIDTHSITGRNSITGRSRHVSYVIKAPTTPLKRDDLCVMGGITHRVLSVEMRPANPPQYVIEGHQLVILIPVASDPPPGEHHHGRITHAHAYPDSQHGHVMRAICTRPECAGWSTHNIHSKESHEQSQS